jgi:hypothetical protein
MAQTKNIGKIKFFLIHHLFYLMTATLGLRQEELSKAIIFISFIKFCSPERTYLE